MKLILYSNRKWVYLLKMLWKIEPYIDVRIETVVNKVVMK